MKQLTGIVNALSKSLTIPTSSLQGLWNTLFWVAVALAGVLALHAGARAIVIWRGWRMPMFFEVGGRFGLFVVWRLGMWKGFVDMPQLTSVCCLYDAVRAPGYLSWQRASCPGHLTSHLACSGPAPS